MQGGLSSSFLGAEFVSVARQRHLCSCLPLGFFFSRTRLEKGACHSIVTLCEADAFCGCACVYSQQIEGGGGKALFGWTLKCACIPRPSFN